VATGLGAGLFRGFFSAAATFLGLTTGGGLATGFGAAGDTLASGGRTSN